MQSMGDSDVFIDFEIIMRQLAKVSSPIFLDSMLVERNLVSRLLGLPEVADDSTMGTADEIQVHEAQRSKDLMANSSTDEDSIRII